MAPGRKRKVVRSENVHDDTATSASPSQAAPSVGVTREELDAAVSGLYQQIETQNNLMMEKLNALLGANQRPVNNEENIADALRNSEGKNIPQGGSGAVEGAPLQAEGSRPSPVLHEHLPGQTPKRWLRSILRNL